MVEVTRDGIAGFGSQAAQWMAPGIRHLAGTATSASTVA